MNTTFVRFPLPATMSASMCTLCVAVKVTLRSPPAPALPVDVARANGATS